MSNKTTINHSYTELIQCFEEKRMNLKKKISVKEAVRRLNTPGEHYGQYIQAQKGEELPCNCEIPGATMRWVTNEKGTFCRFCGKKFDPLKNYGTVRNR